jgi:predicted ArsR family transcriptional regulator
MEREALADLDAVSLLAEPVRRRVYRYVCAFDRPVGRDEVAAAAGIGRSLAAYHLDRLAAHGLLDVEYGRAPGRAGPGAGRPAKLYRRAGREFVVRLPPRNYRLLAELLVRAAAADDAHVLEAARRFGRSYGEHARADGRGLLDVLRDCGYEPAEAEAGRLRLRNCPFDAVAAEHRAVVCGLNLALLRGVLQGLGEEPGRAALEPLPGACCVEFGPQRTA